jgi:hypothetical protein
VTHGTVPTVSKPTTDNTRRIRACGSGWYLLRDELPLYIPTADGLLKGRIGRHTDQDGCLIHLLINEGRCPHHIFLGIKRSRFERGSIPYAALMVIPEIIFGLDHDECYALALSID